MERVGQQIGVTRVADVTHLDRVGLPTKFAYRPSSRSCSVSEGIGLTSEDALQSALLEGLEWHQAERRELDVQLDTLASLRTRRSVVDVQQLTQRLGTPFHEHFQILWTEGVDLLTEADCMVPLETVLLDCFAHKFPGKGCFYSGSNGLAAGANYRQAVLHALLEVVEKDALGTWKKSGEVGWRRRIRLDTIDGDALQQLVKTLQKCSLTVGIWEMTTQAGVPAFYCSLAEPRDRSDSWRRGTVGFAAHFRRDVALRRSILEAVQERLAGLVGVRDDHPQNTRDFTTRRRAAERQWRRLEETASEVDFRQVTDCPSTAPDEQLAWVVEQLAQSGVHQVIAVDLSSEEIEFPVVRVLVPGLDYAVLKPHLLVSPKRPPKATDGTNSN